ncbi:hypothetical protein O3P69_004237 [Scylla paramamosain]|uniref:RNA polymerase II elongation factor ELL N-terminal domain-containing protein n=1 Tax=Scylla paramamosain TaxID=85552 RepID=A0AAW0UJI3_SCYPA
MVANESGDPHPPALLQSPSLHSSTPILCHKLLTTSYSPFLHTHSLPGLVLSAFYHHLTILTTLTTTKAVEIIIPCRNNGTSKFSFTFQPIQESGGPQGSFEFIKQLSPRALESLGPMVARLWIHAKDDTYEKTRKSMENAQKQGKMNCVKEVTNAAANPFVRQRPSHGKMNMVAPHKKKDIMGEQISSKFSSNNSTSPHRHQSGGTTGPPSNTSKPPPPPPPNVNGRNSNPDLVRRPLRERIIQLLAVKNYKKLELINRLHSEPIPHLIPPTCDQKLCCGGSKQKSASLGWEMDRLEANQEPVVWVQARTTHPASQC